MNSVSRLYYSFRSRWLIQRHKIQGGRGVRFFTPLAPWIANYGTLKFGEGVRIDCFSAPARLTCEPGATLEIGAWSYINSGAQIFARQQVVIGDHARIAEDAYLCDTNFHEITPNEPPKVAPIKLGRNVWVGRKATVLPGVTIGDHSVVAAGAVVSKDVPARSVVAGVPAKVLRTFECADNWVRR
jgi:acetyltransferase-like isoleucine patch superfamily enzyme